MRPFLLGMCAIFLVACAGPGTRSVETEPSPSSQAQPRTMIMASNTEVQSLAPKMIGPTNPTRTTRLFNAALALIDEQGAPRPYLASELPQLNTDSWRVLPGGRMETVWNLRPGLTWHDGESLVAEDF